METDHTELDDLLRLITGSVAIWRLQAEIEAISTEPPTILVRSPDGCRLYITRETAGELPPCWEVRRTEDSTRDSEVGELAARRYAAVPGMLRAVRAVLDPGARSGRLVVGTRPA